MSRFRIYTLAPIWPFYYLHLAAFLLPKFDVYVYDLQDYEIDEQSQEYRSLHPVASKKQPTLVEEHFEPVMEGAEDDDSGDSDASEGESDDDGDMKKKSRVPRFYPVTLIFLKICMFLFT